MSALLGHADAARCKATAFDMEADAMAGQGEHTAAGLLFAIGRAYDRAALLMLEENRRQIEAPRETPPTR